MALHQHTVSGGEVLITKMGDPPGDTALYPLGLGVAVITADCVKLRPEKRLALPEFLVFALRAPVVKAQLAEITAGVAQQKISLERFRGIGLPIPPVEEQQRIVAKLDTLTARTARARADLDRAQRLASPYRKAILHAALSGELTAQWREEREASWSNGDLVTLADRRRNAMASRRGSRLREMPPLLLPGSAAVPSWASGCVADIADLIVGYAFKSDWFSNEGPLLMRGANVAVGRVSWDDAKRLRPDLAAEYAAYVLHEGDIVLAMDRPLISGGLKIAQLSKSDAGSLLVQRVACPRPTPAVDRRYLWWVLNSDALIGEIERHASGSDLPHISSNDILATPVPLPPLAEQVEIARRLDQAFSEIDRLTGEAAAARRQLDRLDQALLAKAFRGELVPQDPCDEPASVLLKRIRAERASGPAKARRGRPVAA